MPAEQSARNHAKLDPMMHFAIMPLLTLNFAFSFVLYNRHPVDRRNVAIWWIVLSFVFILMAVKTRLYALRNQDRLIRLEERLRLTALTPAAEHASIHALTLPQLIALRFAPDAELPSLARRALAENLSAKQIKESIATWRPDNHRI